MYLIEVYSRSTHLHGVKNGKLLAVETRYPTGSWVVCISTSGIFNVHCWLMITKVLLQTIRSVTN